MTQPSLLDAVEPTTFRDRLAAYLRARPGQYIDGLELAKVGGVYGWRTRISNCRELGMRIENRQRKVGKKTVSEYAFFPSESAIISGAREC